MLGLFKTKGINPDNGKPNVVAVMFNESFGVSVEGGAMASGTTLEFGDHVTFDRSQWEMIATGEEVLEWWRETQAEEATNDLA